MSPRLRVCGVPRDRDLSTLVISIGCDAQISKNRSIIGALPMLSRSAPCRSAFQNLSSALPPSRPWR